VSNELHIGGFVPLSTIDYPDALAAVIFCQGCSWRCRYCHNPELLSATEPSKFQWSEILNFLKKRQGLLDAVVFSGGEPTLQKALLPAIKQVQNLGFKIGMHTAGSNPNYLQQILPYIDWIGFDIKAIETDYSSITGNSNSGKTAWDSAIQVIASKIQYEIRITVHPDLMSPQELVIVIKKLEQLGTQNIVLQPCRTNTILDPTLHNALIDLKPYQDILNTYGIQIHIRQ